MKKSDSAIQTFSNGFNCSQSVFSTYCGELGLDPTTALKISCGFGGGMAYIGETCGAVTGAFMLIGLKWGKIHPDDSAAKEKTYALIQEFTKRFKAKHGSVNCKNLIGCDIGTEKGKQEAIEKNLFSSICAQFVKDSSEIVEELLNFQKDSEEIQD